MSIDTFPLEQLKTWYAVFVEGANLTVKNRFFCVDLFREFGQLRIARGHLDLVARDESRFAVLDEAHGPESIPLGFKDPFRIRKRIVNKCGQHWVDRCGHARLARGRTNR